MPLRPRNSTVRRVNANGARAGGKLGARPVVDWGTHRFLSRSACAGMPVSMGSALAASSQ
eukprot:scaffold322570_cov35-Tisochrysis_lutea.AAC.1